MENSKYDNILAMALDIAKHSGVTFTSLGEELGSATGTVSRWRDSVQKPKHPKEVFNVLFSRAKTLSRIDLDTYDINHLKKDFGITKTALAEEMNVSREYVRKIIAHGLDSVPDRKKEIQNILRSIGRNLLKSLSKYHQ